MRRESPEGFESRIVTIHGYRRAYRMMGDGPALLLVHGLGCDSTTWCDVAAPLAERFTVVAPDLLGHGESDKPRADYSLGGYANAMRDLLTYLEIERVTVIGHSLGGGVAMQFAYQYPERTERLGLVSPGGLGAEVSPLVRGLTLPGATVGLDLLTRRPLRDVVGGVMRGLGRTGLPHTRDLGPAADVFDALSDRGAREAICAVTRHAVDWRGQRITMNDRAYLAELIPLLVVWGSADDVIPVRHALALRERQPDAIVEVFEGSAHFAHVDDPERFVDVVERFVDEHRPARFVPRRWTATLRGDARAEEEVVTSADAAAAVVDITLGKGRRRPA